MPTISKDTGNVGVAGLPLNTVRNIEHQARPLPLDDARHELPQLFDEVFVPLESGHQVATRLQCVRQTFDGTKTDLLPIRDSKKVDDTLAIAVVNDGNFHRVPFLDGDDAIARVVIRLPTDAIIDQDLQTCDDPN